MKRRADWRTALVVTTAIAGLAAGTGHAKDREATGDGARLETDFRDPPATARPRVWWHWMNGNISDDGIRKDLAWMKRAGLGGVQNFDANQETPQIVPKRLTYMTPEWKRAFQVAASEAQRLGLELAIASSPGWSETGAPWVAPEDGMKKLAWSERLIEGGKRFDGVLPAPANVTGPFGDLPTEEGVPGKQTPSVYRDFAVFAYPVGPGATLPAPRYNAGDQQLDTGALVDGKLMTSAIIDLGTRESPATVTATFASPQEVRSLTLAVPGIAPSPRGPGLLPRLEASRDGKTWTNVTDIPVSDAPSTASFASIKASQFRVVFARPDGTDRSFGGGLPSKLQIRELRFSGESRVNLFEPKAGFSTVRDYYALDAGANPRPSALAPRDVVTLTDKVRADGTLDWSPPAGSNWRVVRLGWSLIGKTNHPASPEATGLEVDKMDPAAVRRYLDKYLAAYRSAAGEPLVGKAGVRAIVNDSTEVGPFNWTGDMAAQFRRLRGYDLAPWLPVLTGAVVGSREQSDAFLYDYRRTIGELHVSAHYGTIAQVAHENGLKVYGEAVENARSTLGDDMAMRRFADYPMAAMWYVPRGASMPAAFMADIRGAASVAHVYGQNIAAAESLTSIMNPWNTGPNELKQIIDLEFALGVNRPVIHTSVHQPVDDKVPGLSLGVFGQYFTRHETWAEMARPWVDYIARSAYMLQQGRNVADVAFFYGEEAPLTSLYATGLPTEVPAPFAYDFVDPDALRDALKVEGPEIVAKGGARYRVLYLGGSSRWMTLSALRQVAALVEAGATVVGEAPQGSPGLGENGPEYEALKRKLWSGQTTSTVGKGRVIAGRDVGAALALAQVAPDFEAAGVAEGADLRFVHRHLDNAEIYFVNNRQNRKEAFDAHFRVTGKAPEIWRATTGKAEAVSYRIENGRTTVPLALDEEEAVFVVFRKPANVASATLAKAKPVTVATLDGPWQVSFEPGRGAPASTTLQLLSSLSESNIPGIRYFSGIATYTQSLRRPAAASGERLWLDLGDARDVAEVRINGKLAGGVWHAPYRVEVTGLLRPGVNKVEVKVANLWVNRLIGDQQPDAKKITWTAIKTYSKTSKLRPSGLLGPVQLLGQGR
ncbi:hypothetical protein HNO88_002538 [Novosphingobium chloroacetimidivorans]|uniref:Glycoside hydrolase n=1 Tax=Novosphingobium chloroacetimidivorans TaxID=1428314 RepID=A0A7W7KBI0_9SPHN|nr:glycosyl hydrolase [Novosphingobium chloroacetimidivorans]MBB4859209.1 hypothetical protein [Novosphingobium chloroacetimidivorans]